MNNATKLIIASVAVVCGFHFVGLTAVAEEPAARIHTFPITIPDATIVIFKKGDSIGVARITNQRLPPDEGCDVEWFLRDDGSFDFSSTASGVTTGTIKGTRQIKFGPFNSGWSVNTDGRGFVYLTDDYYTGVIVGTEVEKLKIAIIGTKMITRLNGDFISIDVTK